MVAMLLDELAHLLQLLPSSLGDSSLPYVESLAITYQRDHRYPMPLTIIYWNLGIINFTIIPDELDIIEDSFHSFVLFLSKLLVDSA